MKFVTSILFAAALTPSLVSAQSFHKVGSISIGGTGGWDYLTADDETHRLYISHTAEVDVVDLKTGKVAGKISGLSRVHGIAIADDLKLGFISDGGANQVVVFDLKTLTVKNKIAAGKNPDGIVYDAPSKKVLAFNGGSQSATVIDATSGKVDATIPLGGKPEFPVSDGKGNVYDNIEDKSEIVRIDTKNLKVTAHWPVSPCESPSGMAIDTAGRRLFSVCDNKMMAVVDADSGKVIGTPVIGDEPDAAGYDPKTKLAFSSNGEGTLTVVRQSDKNHFSVVENAPTAEGARTMALDPETHRVYLPSAEYGAAPAATAKNAHPRKPVLADTFKVLVFGQ